MNVAFLPLCDVMKRQVTVSAPRSDCGVFSLLKHTIDLIFLCSNREEHHSSESF